MPKVAWLVIALNILGNVGMIVMVWRSPTPVLSRMTRRIARVLSPVLFVLWLISGLVTNVPPMVTLLPWFYDFLTLMLVPLAAGMLALSTDRVELRRRMQHGTW